MRRTCVALAALLLAACGRDRSVSDPGPVRSRDARLVRVAGCDELASQLRARAIAEMEARLEANLELSIRYRGGVGVPEAGGAVGAPAPAPATPTTGGGAGASDGATQWTDTNVQVAGVDEPDFVKTDGRYVYVVADGRFQVLDAWPAASTRRVGEVAVDGTPTKLLVTGDRAVVFSSLDGSVLPMPGGGGGSAPMPGGVTALPVPPGGSMPMPMPWMGGTGECTYGYDCVPQGDGRPAQLTVLDLADRAAPRVLRTATFDGSLLAARRIGDAVHAVVTFPEQPIAGVEYGPELREPAPSEAALRAAFEALRARNRRLIEATDFTARLPRGRELRGGATAEVLPGGCEGFHASAAGAGNGFLSLVSFSLANDAPLAATTAVGHPGFVSASAGSLYVAAPLTDRPYRWDAAPADEWTAVHAFRLDGAGGAAGYLGSGAVLGRPLNQFALDEHEGALRVATTAGHSPDPRAYNLVTVLRPEGGALVEVGRVDGLAPSEDVRAVRFDGERGFVVTFKKTDPLFVLDLADPAAPRVVGELKVPGFSTYMQLVDGGHLLTIGYDADDQGGFAWFRGIQLQLFDVRDPARPALAHREVIGTRGSSSAAATNHLAFTWFGPRSLLAIPMTRCEGGEAWQPGRMTFSGLMVYRVTPAGGFSHVGDVAHAAPEPPGVYDGRCSSWWTQSTSLVERSLFLEDFVYSLTRREVRVQDVRAMGTDVARVALAP